MEKEKMPKALKIVLFLLIGTLPAIISASIINQLNSPAAARYYDLFVFIILPIIALLLWVISMFLEEKKKNN